jgi:hypothetical protein
MAEIKVDRDMVDLAVKYNAIRMWLVLIEKLEFQPANKKEFLAAVEPEIRKALEESNERTKREGGHPTSLVDQPQAVGGQLEPRVPKPACEWGGGVCR